MSAGTFVAHRTHAREDHRRLIGDKIVTLHCDVTGIDTYLLRCQGVYPDGRRCETGVHEGRQLCQIHEAMAAERIGR